MCLQSLLEESRNRRKIQIMNYDKGDIITLQRKDGSEQVRAIIVSYYHLDLPEAKEVSGTGYFIRHRGSLWEDFYGDWWQEIINENNN